MPLSKRIVALLPTALALALYAYAYAESAREQRAEGAFQSFSRRLEQKQLPAAGRDIERAVGLAPENAYYLAGRGLLLARMIRGRFDAAAFLENRLAFDQEDLRRIEAAARYYEKSLALNPLDDSHQHNLGWLYSFLQKREQARRCFQKAVSIDGSVAFYHVSLGLSYEQGGDRELAYGEYALAVRLSPATLDSRFFQDLRERSPEAAERVIAENISRLEDELRRSPGPVVRGKLGKLYLRVNSPDAAADMLRQAAAELPSLSRPWHNLGNVYEARGDDAAAKECYEKAVFLDAGDFLSWRKLGEYHDRHGDVGQALRGYTRAVDSWMRMRSEHAGRVLYIYQSRFMVADDVVPNGYLAYCSPQLDVPEICRRLVTLFEEAGDMGMSSYYENLGKSLTP
jgi:tetratricopeptide (TPR) repeat protein